jgi:hypothetical protein
VSHKLFAALGYAQKPKFRIEIMPTPADVEPTPDDLLASAIRVIQETWARNRKGPYGSVVHGSVGWC